jgi:hypothetical protein
MSSDGNNSKIHQEIANHSEGGIPILNRNSLQIHTDKREAI